jgi:hypothetical protein
MVPHTKKEKELPSSSQIDQKNSKKTLQAWQSLCKPLAHLKKSSTHKREDSFKLRHTKNQENAFELYEACVNLLIFLKTCTNTQKTKEHLWAHI